ncbi:MAG TPA: tetratricopeptide repeat protein, partial [Cyclobacteriaceae bacterium]|nr:tetratricopeptide repeat protein [Cyclobacteriaceae bacterium]
MKPSLLVILLAGSSLLLQAQPAEEKRGLAAVRNSPDSVDIYATRIVAYYDAAGNDTSAFQFYLNLGIEYLDAGETPKSIESFQRARVLAAKKKLGSRHLWSLNDSFGMVYGNRGMYDSALWYHSQAATIVAPDTLKMVSSMRKIGLQYNSLGQPVQALATYLQALELLGHRPAKNLQASLYNNLGILYEDDGNLSKAEEYYVKAATLFKELNIPRSNFNILNNLGILYSMQGKNDESLKILAEAEALLPEIKGQLEIAIVNLNIGNTLAHMGRAAESIPRFEKAMTIFNSIQDMYGIALCHRQLGEALHLVGRNTEGEKHEFESLKLSRAKGFEALIEDSYYDLSRIYEARGDFKNAYKYHKLNTHLKDSVNDKEKQAKLGLLEKEFELSRQEKEKQRLEQENEIQQARARANQNAQIALAVGLGLFIFAAAVAGVAWLRTRKQNVILAEQKAKIEEQAGQLVEAARNKSKFFANVSHELRTPITLLNGMLELMQEGNHNGSQEKLKVAVSNSRRLQTLVDEVLDLSRLEVGKATLQTRRLHIFPLLNRIVMAFESFLVRKQIRLEYEPGALDDVMVDIDEDKFEKILNNLLYNAIKFNKPGGWIKVTGALSGDRGEIIIDVADSGIGIPEADVAHIFERFYQSSAGDGKNAQGIGIGLSLVKEFTELHKGTVSVTSVVDEGTSFRLTFPASTEVSLDAEVDTIYSSLPVSISFE